MPRVSSALVVAGALTAVLTSTATARADIDPPRGLDWLRRHHLIIENADAFPDHVLVNFPCYEPRAPSGHEYCVVRPGDAIFVELTALGIALYAIAAADVRLEVAPNGGAWFISTPKIADDAEFIAHDPRVIRPGLELSSLENETVPMNAGIQLATYYLRIDRIDAHGIKAHFTRAKYLCGNGAEVELDWDATHAGPPVPTCPVSDDHGETIPVSSGSPQRGATSPLPSDIPPRRDASADRMVWLGALLASVSLLAGGLLLRK